MTTHLAGGQLVCQDRFYRQCCQWCGEILVDVDLARVAVPEGMDPTPAFWPVNHWVEVIGPPLRQLYRDRGELEKWPRDSCMAASVYAGTPLREVPKP